MVDCEDKQVVTERVEESWCWLIKTKIKQTNRDTVTLSRLIKRGLERSVYSGCKSQQDPPGELSRVPTNIFNAVIIILFLLCLEIVPRILILRGLGAQKWTIYSDRLLDVSLPSSLRGSPTDKSEIPIWFPQSNVTKSNVTKPLLQIGFLTHWKEKSGILVRTQPSNRRTFNIHTILFPGRRGQTFNIHTGGQTVARKVQTNSQNMWEKYFPGILVETYFLPCQRKMRSSQNGQKSSTTRQH